MAGRYNEDLFEQTGPYEPITTRIRNILREYKDGVGIFKELIQNADDAGASTVQLLVDWRRGPTDSLFSPGMAECQGPALWAYNDAVFTDEDFENINKLAGETKVEDLSKIGRFGLGFNAVYHLTDVPSFVSREYFVIFDPNARHLEHHIRDRSRPGIRINLAKKADALTRYHDQFLPYNGVFGCNTTPTRGAFNYNGTLFRFPFRTASQASTSDISKTPYGRERIQAIVRSLSECASTLLIFSQNIKTVEIYELDNSRAPNQMRLMLSVNKPIADAFKSKGVKSNEPFIKQCSKWWEQLRDSQKPSAKYPSGCELVYITTTKEPSELSGCNRKISDNEMWFVASASGTNVSLTVARSEEGRSHGLLPCGGAAFAIQRVSGEGSWESCITSGLSGELFCFLPLSISTGLPMHVNGYFAIMSNRAEIWKRTAMRNQPIEVTWNEALMEDALARAYIMLLEEMKEFSRNVENYKFHTLWPSCNGVDMKSWGKLVQKVYSVLLEPQSKLFCCDGKWMSISDGFLLSDVFDEIYEPAVDVLRSLGKHVFNLPSNILKTLATFDEQSILQRRTLTFSAFLKQHFFPNIKKIPPTQRDAIVCFGLDRILMGDKSLEKLFQQNACVAVSENNLAKPRELIHPYSDAAQLFSREDHRFPVGDDLCDDNRLYVLVTLGMVKDLSWEGIYERAQSIAHLGFCAGTERSRKLIEYLNKRISQLPNPAGYRNLLQCVRFMPVLTRPVDDYLLSWKGSSSSIAKMLAPNDVFLPKNAKLVGSSCYIVNTSSQSGCGKMNDDVQDLLGFSSRFPEDNFVIQQLDEAIKFWCKLSEEEKQDTGKRLAIESICQKIYKFFNSRVAQRAINQNFLNKLDKRGWLFFQGMFVQSKKVAYACSGNGAPFLFTLPPSYKRDYRNLFEAMQIKQTFDEEDYISALYELQRTKQRNVLTEEELKIAIFFICQIQDVEKPAVKKHIGNIPMPDTNRILRPGKDVVVNLSLWLTDAGDTQKVHERIPPQTARALGARPLKNVVLKKYSRRLRYGESFGQHEDLTDRLQGILDGYPADGILKELVQNADDAQASEIHFIFDTRTLASVKVVTEKETSEELQGPALCVYNDKPFTEKDLEGIKHLGIGSKRSTLGMTGKYGIGFNSVYHLTDCPSFLSDDDTLVFLDPHCRYVPDAESDDPGALFKPIDEKFRNEFPDTLDGYLPGHFNLQGSTMFRFPLRREFQSKISNVSVDMENLLLVFQKEALNSLLFLNHIKKITLSKIGPSNTLEKIYQVEIVVTSEDDKKRHKMAQKISDLSGTPTAEIGWQGISYALTIKENKKEVEKWLIQQCIGSTSASCTGRSTFERVQNKIPDGRNLGLLPRGGLAARLWTHRKKEKFGGIAYCFLPLPENYTNLPVHVNGHFALDSTRRGLWTETDGKGPKSEWNHFIKSCVLPQAYAALILEAKKHLCNDKNDNQLSRYHALFPKVSYNSPWKTLVIELYRYLGQTRAKALPLLIPTEGEGEGSGIFSAIAGMMTHYLTGTRESTVHVTCTAWLSANQAYFVTSGIENPILHLLMRIGLPVLLHAPSRIHAGFESAHITSHTVNPTSAVDFLRGFKSPGSTCKIGQLPEELETTAVKNVQQLSALIEYCRDMKDFGKHLKGLPLLLTQDGFLRVFDSHQPVFGSKFGDLIPTQSHLFVHSKIVYQIAGIANKSEENIIRTFTVRDLAELLPHVFTDPSFKHNDSHITWDFPPEGILSRNWFMRLWNYLQNYARPALGEDSVSLECLAEWPLIPTTCGKLVTIKKGKTVLDMTMTGNESTMQENVRTFLRNLKCLVLNKEITSETEDQTTTKKAVLERKTAVTDPCVAHPHNVEDVLLVLHHMLKTNGLHISLVHEYEIRNFLQFVQDNYKADRLTECKRIIKCLPFHKALDGQYVSLIGQYSYVLVPSGVPTQQLDELQRRANCLFLDSGALFALEKLYSDLGVRAGQNVTQFYVENVFKHFSMFTRESQMQHLIYIRDKVYPSLPRRGSDETKLFLDSMTQNPCIPDESGHLHYAWEFYDPNNKVFKLMFQDEESKFPPSPFNKEDWSDLLQDIGLFVEITPQLFLEFCTKVAEVGRQTPCNPQNHQRSRVLVKCLFSEQALQEEMFLSQLSQITFVAPVKMDEELTSIHEQYQCPEDGYPPFIKFRNAVPWRFRFLSWTTTTTLPIWALPNNMAGLQSLGIACSGPTYAKVVEHLRNVAASYSPDTVSSDCLQKITQFIYRFLCGVTKCGGHNPTDSCSEVCRDIGDLLKGVPCIFLQEDKVFVKAEQLVFNLPNDCPLKPFLYRVPREYGVFEHFLKRLGTTENPKPLQLAYLLNAMHDQVGQEALSSKEEKTAKYAMYLLFELLYRGERADEIVQLYLPSQDKRLVKSCELVCNVPPRFADVVEKLHLPILLRLQECKLKKPSDDYINALPEHLRPKKFEDIVREDVDPECQHSICPEAEQGSTCSFQQRFESLLRSEEFQEGLKRLLMANNQDPKEFEHIIRKLQTSVLIKCTGVDSIKIRIINRDTNDVLSRLEESCYAVQNEDSWSLYLQHDFKGVKIAKCVNKILEDCINKVLELSAMLSCSSASNISTELNNLDITQSLSISADDFTPPDDDLWDHVGDSGNTTGDGRIGPIGRIGGRGPGGGGGGGGGGSFRPNGDEEEIFFPVDREEAMRWVKQSKIDLEGARWLLQSDPPFSALACFQSHQVAEKCFKAMLYADCGIWSNLLHSHKIQQLQNKVREETEIPEETVQFAKEYYLGTRYPNRHPPGVVPAEEFNRDEAKTAIRAASKVLEDVENYLLR